MEIQRERGVASIYRHVPIDALMNRTDPLMALPGTAKMVGAVRLYGERDRKLVGPSWWPSKVLLKHYSLHG